MAKPMLEVKDLHAWYGESHVLHGVDFDVQEGEVVTLLGRNGAGRTSTLRSMSNSRLRTKSLRFFRSIMAFNSDFSRSSSAPSCWREFRSAQSVAGLDTKRTTLRKKLSSLGGVWGSVMGSRRGAVGQSPNIFCFISRRCCASSESVAVGRASSRPRPIGSPVSSQWP